MGQLFTDFAYLFLFGVVACAFAVAELAELIGFGSHRIVSTLIGSVVGIIILFAAPTAAVVAMIVAAAVSLIASIVLDKLF